MMITENEFKEIKRCNTVKECSEILKISEGQIYYRFGGIIKELKEEKKKSLYDDIKDFALTGESKTYILKKFGVDSVRVSKLMDEFGEIEFKKKNDTKIRNKEIVDLLSNGTSHSDVGKLFNISRQRVYQIERSLINEK